MKQGLLDEQQGAPGRGEITNPAILEALLRPSKEQIAALRRMQEESGAALHHMRLHPWQYLVD